MSFDTTASAFAFKTAAEEAGLAGRLIPIPRVLSAGCGMAWREPAAHRPAVESLLQKRDLDYSALVEMLL